MSPASRAPLIYEGMVSQGSQSFALGLAKTAATPLARANSLNVKRRLLGHRLVRDQIFNRYFQHVSARLQACEINV